MNAISGLMCAALAAVACLTLTFACTASQGAVVVSDITAVGFCELNYIETNPSPTPAGAVLACAGLLLSDAEKTFATLSAMTADGGAPTPVAAKLKGSSKGAKP